jgi:predicted permease
VPLIYAIIFALILNILNFKLPEVMLIPIDMIGQVTIPLALIVLGYRLTKIKIKDAQKAFLASIFKMGAGLILALLLISIFSIEGVLKNVLILIASMPSAVLTMVICHKYRRDADLVASVILISTLLSLISIPLILLFL